MKMIDFQYEDPQEFDGRGVWGRLPCQCCGMSYEYKDIPKTIRSAGKGIRVLYGEHGRQRKTEKLSVDHVKTKNGTITVVIALKD